MRWAVAMLVMVACAEDQHKLESGAYAKVMESIKNDDCGVAQPPLGQVDMSYGRLTVSDVQVTHTTQFTNEVYQRSGNALHRPPEMHDLPATGNCVLTDTLSEEGSLTADDVVEITRKESHAVKSGDCTNVVRSMCSSEFTYKITRIGP